MICDRTSYRDIVSWLYYSVPANVTFKLVCLFPWRSSLKDINDAVRTLSQFLSMGPSFTIYNSAGEVSECDVNQATAVLGGVDWVLSSTRVYVMPKREI